VVRAVTAAVIAARAATATKVRLRITSRPSLRATTDLDPL
jgi:hypothetical protein